MILSKPEKSESYYEDAAPLSEEIKLKVKVKSGKITLYYGNSNRDYDIAGIFDKASVILQGTACSEKDILGGLLSLNIKAEKNVKNQPCQLFFEGGGYSTDAQCNFEVNSDFISIKMNNEMIVYNGHLQENERSFSEYFYYINTYPYGFIIQKDDHFYRYQDPVKTLQKE